MTDLAALLAKLRAMIDDSSRGPWTIDIPEDEDCYWRIKAFSHDGSWEFVIAENESNQRNGRLIVASHKVMGLLLDAVEAAAEIVNTPKRDDGIPVKTPNDLIRDMDRISAALSRLAAAEVGP